VAQRERGLLVYNPTASTTSRRARDVLISALGEELKLDLAETKGRDHATEIAALARADGIDVVVALGGDGTANEVVNGLLAEGPGPDVPDLAVVPGGCTNVFARSVGYPQGAVEATGHILEALRAGRRRTIGLGRADERWFLFASGLGFDAEVVERVERARAAGRRASGPRYARAGFAHGLFGAERRRPPLALQVPGQAPVDVFLALVTNADPWTYLLDRPVRPTPASSYDEGLDVFALTGLRTLPTLRALAQILRREPRPHGRRVVLHHDLPGLVLASTDGAPRAFQVDGDFLGTRDRVVLRSEPRALRVVV